MTDNKGMPPVEVSLPLNDTGKSLDDPTLRTPVIGAVADRQDAASGDSRRDGTLSAADASMRQELIDEIVEIMGDIQDYDTKYHHFAAAIVDGLKLVGMFDNTALNGFHSRCKTLEDQRNGLLEVLLGIKLHGGIACVDVSGGDYTGGKKPATQDMWAFPRWMLTGIDAAIAKAEGRTK